MEKSQFAELINTIKRLERKLDILISIVKTMAPKPTIGTEEKGILTLCNAKNSIDDMVQKTNKSRNNIRVILSHLKSKGLIKSIKIKNKLVYVKI